MVYRKTPSNKENPSALRYLFQKTWQYSEGNQKKLILCWIMFVCSEMIDVFGIPIVSAKMIDIVNRQGITPSSLHTLSLLLLLIFSRTIMVWSLHGPARVMECSNAFKARANYRRFLLSGLLTLPLEWHTDHHSGDTIDKLNKGANSLNDFSEGTFQIVYCLVRLVGCYGMLIYFSHSAALIVAGMIVVSGLVTIHFDKTLIANYKKINWIENQISESIADTLNNISTVIILRVEKLVFSSIMHKVDGQYDLVNQTSILCEWKWFWTSVCCAFMTTIVIFTYFYQHLGTGPRVLVMATLLLLSYTNKIGDLFFGFCSMYGDIVKRKTRVMNAEELSNDFTTESLTNHVLPKQWETLDIRNLSFSYQETNNSQLHLKNVSLSIRRGQRIALIGERGSGKTTLLKIIRDLYHPKELTLTVDGKIIPEGFAGISRAISLVQQNPEIFTSTILANITMGAEYDLDVVRSFTDMACFSDVVDNLPKGLNSSLKEKGVNLSGGQQQCLALSRGLLACHDKDIVLLDEPTSSLDTITEIAVYKKIIEGFSSKTIISTIHKLHLLPLFDCIYVFDKGEIVGSGTMLELSSSCPKFVSLLEAMQKVETVLCD
jgi:ATP-binding cassette, subfamily B, bacterial